MWNLNSYSLFFLYAPHHFGYSKAKHVKKQTLDGLKVRLEEANKKLKITREKIIAARVSSEFFLGIFTLLSFGIFFPACF